MNKLPKLKDCTISVLGLGYVGLPLAIEFTRCRRSYLNNEILDRNIIGFDINQKRINELRQGVDITNEVSDNMLLGLNNIIYTNDLSLLKQASVFIVTVPTPIDSSRSPDLTILKKACVTIGKTLKERHQENISCKSSSIPVVIFESTVYPGATEEICIPVIKEESGLSIYSDSSSEECFAYGYSPERINPGDKEHRISSITKVTSGNNEEVANWVNLLYGSIIKSGTYNAVSIKVAEAAKVIENTQRDLNIALINELSIIFKHLGIDTLDVLKAAETKWNFLPFKPGLVGGHCIGVDPYYLTFKSEQSGYSPQIILAGRRINDNMANWHIEQLILDMIREGIPIINSNALILGFTFKENCPDIRNTKVMDIINSLNQFNIQNTIVDPYANANDAQEKYNVNIESNLPKGRFYSIIILAVSHQYFCDLTIEDWKSLCSKEYIILDLKGIVPRELKPKRP